MGAWVMDSVGWWYRNADGSYPTNTSMVIDGRTYRFDGRGYMRTCWVLVDGSSPGNTPGPGAQQRAPGPGALDTSAPLHISVSNTVIIRGIT